MPSKQLQALLVYSLPVLLVLLAVDLAGYVLVEALQDALGARILLGVGVGLMLLLAAGALLLLMLLGVRLLDDERRGPPE